MLVSSRFFSHLNWLRPCDSETIPISFQEFAANKKGSFNQMLADGMICNFNLSYTAYIYAAINVVTALLFSGANAQNTTGGPNTKSSVTGKPITSVPATNLNMGMDLWNNTTAASGAAKARANAVSSAIVPAPMVGRDGVMPEQWVQVCELPPLLEIISQLLFID